MASAPVLEQGLPAKSVIRAASAVTSGSVSAAIGTAFQNDAALRSAIAEQLKERVATVDVSKRAKKVFENFKPSSHSPSMHAAKNFLAPGGRLTHAQQGAMDRSLESLRNSSINRTLTLHPTPALASLMQTKRKSASGATTGTINFPDLLSYLNTKVPPARLLARSSPINICEAKIEAAAAMKSITNPKAGTASNAGGGSNSAADPSQNEKTSEAGTSDFSHLTATQIVKDNVGLQMKTASSPESQLMYAIPNKNPTGNIDTFELRQGPSDVTSYHDFNTLQIAFESVWTELIDSQLTGLGQQLYEEYVKLKVFTGTDDGADLEMSTLDDLSNLMDTIRSFTNTIADSLPPNFQPTETSPDSGGSLANNVVGTATLAVATGGLSLLFGAALDAISKAGQKPLLTWDDFPGPLPGHGDQIEVSFEDGVTGAGTVEIVLTTDQGSHWKGIGFQTWDSNTEKLYPGPQISNGGNVYRVVLPLITSLIPIGVLEFDSEQSPGLNLGRYLLGDLAKKLKDRTRVTFHWKG